MSLPWFEQTDLIVLRDARNSNSFVRVRVFVSRQRRSRQIKFTSVSGQLEESSLQNFSLPRWSSERMLGIALLQMQTRCVVASLCVQHELDDSRRVWIAGLRHMTRLSERCRVS